MIQEVMFRYQKCRSYIQKQLTLLRVQHVQKKGNKDIRCLKFSYMNVKNFLNEIDPR